MKTIIIFIAIFLLVQSSAPAGEYHRSVEKNGTVSFTDNPTAKEVRGMIEPSEALAILKKWEVGNKNISKEEMMIYYKGNRQLQEEWGRAAAVRRAVDREQELQRLRDKTADWLEKNAKRTIYDSRGREVGERVDRSMMLDATRLRMGLNP